MKEHKNEDIYRHIAKQYTERSGQLLRQENTSHEPLPDEVQKRLDTRLHKSIRAVKIRKFTKITAAAAACLLLILLLPLLSRIQKSGNTANDTALEQSQPEIPEATLIPLSFSLPENLSVSNTKVDRGISVYYLTDTLEDNVVMQLESVNTAETYFDALSEITIDGHQAFGLSTRNYQLLTFIHEDIVYTLTCQYDFNTLIELSKNIF